MVCSSLLSKQKSLTVDVFKMENEIERKRRGAKRSSGLNESSPRRQAKRAKEDSDDTYSVDTPGKIKRIYMCNFMCHDALEIEFNKYVNFIVGRNGSGKSAILTALTVGLGARANITKRGTSIKEFIKKGKNSAMVEVSIYNEGPMAYKPDVYGDTIKIQRTISASSSYKIKNWRDETVSTKREELDNMLSALRIQIDNPISVMNQDVSRTFLVSSKPEERYELFMKATSLDIIGSNYKEAQMCSIDAEQKLRDANQHLAETRKEVRDIEEKLKRTEKIDESRKELEDLQNEMQWATVIIEEKKLRQYQDQLKKCQENLNSLQDVTNNSDSKSKEIEDKIRKLRESIEEAESEAASKTEAYNQIKQQYVTVKDSHSTKTRELQSCQAKIKRTENDVAMLCKEIARLEGTDNQEHNELKELKQRLTEFGQKLDEAQAMLRTKQTDQMHLEADKLRLQKNVNSAKIDVERCDNLIRKRSHDLSILKQQPGNALTVFGPNMPRLLKRIEEEYRRGRFKQKPRGPLGAHIKMKDSNWAPAVENFLGADFLTSFCVDNSQDAKVLKALMTEVYLNERTPQVTSSKFYQQVHDVSRTCTGAPEYSNLLQAMDISDPVVANCLIDQREVECILLIPTNKEACHLMSHVSRVPRNCKRALTQNADTFFPDPNYRSYGGRRGLRAKFLQVSTREVIRALEEELSVAEEEQNGAHKNLTVARDKMQRTINELSKVSSQVGKLRAAQDELKSQITKLQDKIEQSETVSVTPLRSELVVFEKKLQTERLEEQRLKEEAKELHVNLQAIEAEYKECKKIVQEISSRTDPLQMEIRKLSDEKNILELKSKHAVRKLSEDTQALQKAQADSELQERVVEKVVADAEKLGPRVNTRRSVDEIKMLAKGLKLKIQEIERQIGTHKEDLPKLLAEKQQKLADLYSSAEAAEKCNEKQLKRLKSRGGTFTYMKNTIGHRIQKAFASILALREYKGFIKIDHLHRVLDLQVTPQVNAKRTKDTKSLSGGERSYSTVAFILALWDCTGLPFYFLDEFDVFMDKVNRRTIMDILLNHAKEHPECQFTFLTPLDTSNVLSEGYVKIHLLASPKNENEMEQD